MTTYVLTSIVSFLVFLFLLIKGYQLHQNKNKIMEKAYASKSMFNYNHIISKIAFKEYKGYVLSVEEREALHKFYADLAKKDEENKPIGSYFKLCQQLKSTLNISYPTFKPNELAIGFLTLVAFVIVLFLGITYA